MIAVVALWREKYRRAKRTSPRRGFSIYTRRSRADGSFGYRNSIREAYS
jgi:hypothetical protein